MTKDYYFDGTSALIVAMRKAMPLHARGVDIQSLTSYEDYRSVDGLLVPYRFVERNLKSGEIMSTLQWNMIEVNVPIPDSVFDPPNVSKRQE